MIQKVTKKIKTARSFRPQANTRPGVQSGLYALFLSAFGNHEVPNVIPVFFRWPVNFDHLSPIQTLPGSSIEGL
ncbi:hypothetical protein [Mucilaginibacter paludis]|uniref:hypothetical protein n=1 Tax=Mucilaginibacter paludis TaxID=423351 RepID=UPI0003082ECA|nr:hypothetical protein [Mucilaginibacter paludis]